MIPKLLEASEGRALIAIGEEERGVICVELLTRDCPYVFCFDPEIQWQARRHIVPHEKMEDK